MASEEHHHSMEGLPVRVMLALGNIEKSLGQMNDRLTKLETKMHNAMHGHGHGARSSRFSSVSLRHQRSERSHHSIHHSPVLRRDSSLLTSQDMQDHDSMVMLQMDPDEEQQHSLRNHESNHESNSSFITQFSSRRRGSSGQAKSPESEQAKSPSSIPSTDSPKSAGAALGAISSNHNASEESISALSLPVSDTNQGTSRHHGHAHTQIQSFHELVAMTRVKKQLKTKSRMLPALDEHTALESPSLGLNPSFSTLSANGSSANDNDLERNISSTSAPQSQRLASPSAFHASHSTQSFHQENDEVQEAAGRPSLMTKSVNWLQRNLYHLSKNHSQSHSEPSNTHRLRVSIPSSNNDMRLQMFNQQFNWQVKQAASGVEQLAIKWWLYPWKVFKLVFWDILDPDKTPTREFRMAWDLIMILAMLYILFVTPLTVGFNISTLNVTTNPFAAFDLFINCILMFDVWIVFRTPYREAHDLTLVTDRYLIAKRYVLSGWLLIDIPSSLPWDNMLDKSNLSILKVLRLVRIWHTFQRFQHLKLRNMRGFQEQNIIVIIESVLGTTILSFLKLFFLSFLIIHWAGCFFYWSSSWNNFSSNTWVYRQGLVPGTWNGVQVNNTAPLDVRYLYSIYFTTVTMATVGYGDIVPIAAVEKVVDIFLVFIGVSLFGLLMGLMAQAVSNSSVREARISQRRSLVQDFITERHLPKEIADQVVRFYLFRATKEIAIEEREIISGLPKSLRDLVIENLYSDLVMKFEFFATTLAKHPAFLSSVIQHLKRELYIPGDDIVRQGEIGRSMYFISEGKCEIRVRRDAHPVSPGSNLRITNKETEAELEEKLSSKWGTLIEQGCYLEEGSSFGCYSCLLEEPRAATVLATLYSEIFCLSRMDLEKIIEDWPGLAEDFDLFIEQAEMRTDFDV